MRWPRERAWTGAHLVVPGQARSARPLAGVVSLGRERGRYLMKSISRYFGSGQTASSTWASSASA